MDQEIHIWSREGLEVILQMLDEQAVQLLPYFRTDKRRDF